MYIQECYNVLHKLLGDIYMEYDLEYDTINILNLKRSINLDDAKKIHTELEKKNLKIVRAYSNPTWYHLEITNNLFTKPLIALIVVKN
jgi:hypothetical protein